MRRLFIQDSKSSTTLRNLLNLLVMVTVAILVSDWLFGRLLPYITTEPPYILRLENVPGVESLWKYSEADIKPIVFTGSSQTYAAISPHLFNDRIKALTGQDIQSVNVSLFGSVITIQNNFIRDLIIPSHPKIIIYGIELRALMPASQKDDAYVINDYKNKAIGYELTQPTNSERDLLVWLLRHSNWLRYRDNLREWLTGAREINQGGYFLSVVDDLGYAPFPNSFSQDASYIQAQFVPFTVTDSTRQLMLDLQKNCQQNEVQCILMNMPIHSLAYQYIIPEQEALYRDLLKQSGLPIWDFDTEACRTMLGDTNFFNLNHLNARGSQLFSKMVADVYAQVFFNVPITGNAKCATF